MDKGKKRYILKSIQTTKRQERQTEYTNNNSFQANHSCRKKTLKVYVIVYSIVMDIRNFFGGDVKAGDASGKERAEEIDLTEETPKSAKETPPVASPGAGLEKESNEVENSLGTMKQSGRTPPSKGKATLKRKTPTKSVPSYQNPGAAEAIAAVDMAATKLPTDESELHITFIDPDFHGKPPDEPANRDSKGPPPVGHPDAFAGKTFVISGVLDSMLRPEMEDYICKHGGKVTSAVSGKTSFLIVGQHTGRSKYNQAKAKNTKLITEDGVWSLVSASVPFKISTEEKNAPCIKDEEDTKTLEKAVAPKSPRVKDAPSTGEMQLWVDKWKPKNSSELIGNNQLINNLKSWLSQWEMVHMHGQQASNLAKRGKAVDHKKAVLLSGSPGIGKTSAALIIARECGYEPIEVNASDTRSKSDSSVLKGIGGKLSNTIREMSTNASLNLQGSRNKQKLCLIMDEVDGMSAGDRGGVADLIQTIAKSKVPIIAICNDKYSTKLRSLRNHCLELDFRKPTAIQIQKRLGMICRSEGLNMNDATMNAVIQNANGGDIRLLLGQLQMIRRRTTLLSYDDVSRSSSKDIEMSPFEASQRLLNVDPSHNLSFADQLDLVFQDPDLVPLLVQENYLNHRPQMATDATNRLAVIAKAADEFSGGDLVSRSVRQYQNWSLMPFACALGTVSPASYARGSRETFGLYPNEPNFPRFTAWLGQNSSHGKQKRILGEVHTNMLSSGNFHSDRTALRLDYCSTLKSSLVQPLLKLGKEGIPQVLALMNDYALKREDLDSIFDLTKFKTKSSWGEDVYKKVETAVKTAFTRTFNQQKMREKSGTALKTVKSKKRSVDEAFGDEGVNDIEEEEDDDEGLGAGNIKGKLSSNVELSLKEEKPKKGAKKAPGKKKAKK